jgi:hypothetical protein
MMNVYHWGVLGTPALMLRNWGQFEGPSWEFNGLRGDPKRPHTYYIFWGNFIRWVLGPGAAARSAWTSFAPSAIGIDARPASDIAIVAENLPPTAGPPPRPTASGRLWKTTSASDATPAWQLETMQDVAGQPLAEVGGDLFTRIAIGMGSPAVGYAVTVSRGEIYRKTDVSFGGPWVWRGASAGNVVGLVVHPLNQDTVFAATTATVQVSVDGGQTFRAATGGGLFALPQTGFHALVMGPTDGWLYLATDVGVFLSPDGGAQWYRLDDYLPNAPVFDMAASGDHLYATLHGRGLWCCRIK